MDLVEGSVSVDGSMAYVAQQVHATGCIRAFQTSKFSFAGRMANELNGFKPLHAFRFRNEISDV